MSKILIYTLLRAVVLYIFPLFLCASPRPFPPFRRGNIIPFRRGNIILASGDI